VSEDSALPDLIPTPFQCSVSRQDGAARLQPAGELDMASAPALEDRLRAALTDGARRLVIDLRELEFMDSTGLTLLARWSLGAQRDGYELELVQGDERIRRLFELTGMVSHFRFVDG
jgi:anti-sigma B factor antagonist